MAAEIRLPQWGMGMREGTIVQWLKKEGEPVNEGDPLVEVEAEKVTSEVTASSSGVLLRVLVAEGSTVPVRTVLGLIGAPGESIPEAEPVWTPMPVEAGSKPKAGSEPTAAQVQVTPVARRMAKEHGIDLTRIRGSGPGREGFLHGCLPFSFWNGYAEWPVEGRSREKVSFKHFKKVMTLGMRSLQVVLLRY